MSWRCKKISLLVLSILLISIMAGCRARRFPFPPPPILTPPGRHYVKPPVRMSHHRYRYFPGNQVYYDSSRRIYFYFSNNSWLSVPVLPPHIHIDRDNYVNLELEGPNPYLHHRKNLKRYPPKVWKKKRHQKAKNNKRRERVEDKRERQEEKLDRKKAPKKYRRNDKKNQRKEYREKEVERRGHKKDKRKGYRDEDEEEQNNKNGKWNNDKEGRRDYDQPGWR